MAYLVLTLLLYSGAVKATVDVPYADMATCEAAAPQQIADAERAGAVVVFSECSAGRP